MTDSSYSLLLLRKRIEEAERAQLLDRTGAAGNGSWQSGLDDDAQAMGHVRRSKQVLEETFQTGAAILTNMAGQRERLKVWCCLSFGIPCTPSDHSSFSDVE